MTDNAVSSHGWRPAMEQLRFLGHELALATGGRKIRWFILFFEPSAGVLISYRLDRFGFLLCGRSWTGLRCLAFPLFLLLRLLSRPHEISFKAEIGRGLRVIHPSLGVVVHADAIIGAKCTLYGGNSVGVRRGIRRGDLMLGDDVILGINSCILGPVHIGNHVIIGAGAVVVSDLPDHCMAVGVPAKARERGPEH